MQAFGDCEFWEAEKFWQRDLPIFSPCLRNSFLRWFPSIFLVFGFVLQIKRYLKRYSDEQPNTLYHSKRFVILLLSIGSISELAYFNKFDENPLFTLKTISTLLELVTYAIVSLLFFRSRNKLRLSCLLLLYSLILLITTAARVFSAFADHYNRAFTDEDAEHIDSTFLVFQSVNLALALLFFVLNCCKDSKLPTDSINCPAHYASFLSRASFWWLNSTIWRGLRKPIKEEELWALHPSNKISNVYDRFNRFYKRKQQKIASQQNSPNLNGKSQEQDRNGKLDLNHNGLDRSEPSNGLMKNGRKDPANGSNLKATDENVTPKSNANRNQKNPPDAGGLYLNLLNKPPTVNVFGPLFKAFWPEFLVAALFRLVALCFQFLNPLLLDRLLIFISEPNGNTWEGLTLGVGMFCVMLMNSLFNNQHEFRVNMLAMKVRSALTMAIYEKTLILSSTGRNIYATGEIVNLMSSDCERIFDFVTTVNQMWDTSFQTILSLYMIYLKLGLGFLGAVTCIAITFPWNIFVTRRLKSFQAIEMRFKDDRVNILSEILNGMKCLKLYAWEHAFKDYLLKIRAKEMAFLNKKLVMQICMIQSYTLVPFMVIFFCLALYAFIYPNEVLDANRVFITISLVNILKAPLGRLPFTVSNFIMCKIAVGRVNKFLSESELDRDLVQRKNDSNAKNAILVKNGAFIWNAQTDSKPILKQIHMKVKKKQLIAVVGSVASGKSSLLSALLGEMHRITGEVVINGSVAYVSQQAWILNETLKENILFGNELNQRKYADILQRCQLIPDLKLLADGDNTQIGEKGINLSGGQKQRVSLARAVYAERDIYLFDDPLSALDSNVGKEIFEHVLGPHGMLKNKTRILVTHRISLLPKVDCILVLKNGTISEVGSYSELMRTKGDFAEFVLQHFENEDFDIENIDHEELQDMEQIRSAVRATMNLPIQPPTPIGSKPGSLSGSFRRKSISSTKSFCSNCKNRESQTCYYCERSRQRSESISSRKSFKRKSITSLNKTLPVDEYERDSLLNEQPDEFDEFVEEEEQKKEQAKEKTKLAEVEKIKSGSISSKVYHDYLKMFNRFAFVTVVVSYTTAYAFNYCASIWLSRWADESKNVTLARDPAERNYRIGIYLVLGLSESTFVLIAMIILSRGCLKAAHKIHDTMLHCISCVPMHFFDSTPLGRILNRFAKDMDTCNYLIWMNCRSYLNSLLRSLTSFLIISIQSPTIIIFLLPLAIFYFCFQSVYIRTKRQIVRINLASKAPIFSIYQETILGSSSIRAFGLEGQFLKSCADKIDQNSVSFVPSIAVARWLTFRLELLGNAIVFVCTVFMVCNRDSIASPALVGLAITSALTINTSMNNFVRVSSDMENNVVSIERCIEYFDLEQEDNTPDERSGLGQWPRDGRIEFLDYSTKYRPQLDYVLRDFTVRISPGEKIGVVGRTGAGKSSCTLALFRIIEAYGGRIEIDGRNIADLGLYELRSRLSILPQEPTLFTGTLRLNLDPLNQRGHTDEDLWLALEQAHLKEFISSSPAGLDFAIQESGENLSVGQRQLVCLARALLRRTKVLILDEATAACDVETDGLIQETIRKEFADCTILTIAHRLNTVMDYDRILVLDKGRIAEFDSVENLLANKESIFRSMAKDSGIIS